MRSNEYRILLVEDSPADADLLGRKLSETPTADFKMVRAERLAGALQYLETEQLEAECFDVVLLDLNLPDSNGLDTLLKMHRTAPDIPIVVLTGLDDEMLANQVVRAGAQDFLVKGDVDGPLILRSIRYAIDRQALLRQLEDARQGQAQEREFRVLERLGGPPASSVTAQLFGLAPLSDSVPDAFQQFVRNYQDLMDLSLEQQAFRVNYKLSEKLRAMAEELGFLRAGPKDVIEIHTRALKERIRGTTAEKAKAYMEEGHLLVLELMGYLAQFYRHYYLGTRKDA